MKKWHFFFGDPVLLGVLHAPVSAKNTLMYVCMIQLMNHWSDLDEISHECYPIWDFPKIVLFNYLQSAAPTWQTNKNNDFRSFLLWSDLLLGNNQFQQYELFHPTTAQWVHRSHLIKSDLRLLLEYTAEQQWVGLILVQEWPRHNNAVSILFVHWHQSTWETLDRSGWNLVRTLCHWSVL